MTLQPSLIIVVSPADHPGAQQAVIAAAKSIADVMDDGDNDFEVAVVEGRAGSPADYFEGDAIDAYGRP